MWYKFWVGMKKKFVMLIGDGMADWPIEALGGRTPLEAAHTPWMDFLAQKGEMGMVVTIPKGLPPDSSIANLSLLGYDPRVHYTGRGPFEAASQGIELREGDVAFRCNLVTLSPELRMEDYSAGHITTEEARELFLELQRRLGGREFDFYPGVSFRGILIAHGLGDAIETTPPHDIMGRQIEEFFPRGKGSRKLRSLMEEARRVLSRHPVNLRREREGKPPANGIWPWGQGRRPQMEPFKRRFGLEGCVVAAVDVIKGIGIMAGLKPIDVPGATGWIDSNLLGKASSGLEALKEVDFLYLHVEAPDEASHMGSLKEKIRAIERFDREVVGVVLQGLRDMALPFRLLVATDHPTPLALRTHSAEPVAFVIYDSGREEGGFEGFSEGEAKKGPIVSEGHTLMGRFLEGR